MVKVLVLGGFIVLGFGCADPVSSDDVSGIYAGSGRNLELWAESLPADGFEYQIVADTVRLERDRTGVYVAAWRRRSLSSGDTTAFQNRVRFTYGVVGDRVNPSRTGCEGDCGREPLLGSFTIAGAELRSSAHVFVTYERIARSTP
jgi:hypothetical protein